MSQSTRTVETRSQRVLRISLIVVLAVYVVFVLIVALMLGIDRLTPMIQTTPGLTADARATLALDQADRILSLLEVVLGIIALILPLALGVVVYIFQQNRRTVEQLTDKAERAERNAAHSAERVREYREEARSTEARVNEALNKIALAEARDIERDEGARRLQDAIEEQRREVEDLSYKAEDLLSQSRRAQAKLTMVDLFLNVRRHSVLCTSDDVMESTKAVVTLMELALYPPPLDDEPAEVDPLRVERDMMLRREALRALAAVRDSSSVPAEIHQRLLNMLAQVVDSAEHPMLILEARHTQMMLLSVRRTDGTSSSERRVPRARKQTPT
ncbi:MAG: hypothetical protein B6D42_03575 [Anaerolineae bacterium UTCFX5]|nr:MAG: hypothetical protein B6D42_03575 [Anaerolineae bacterium UTCFX5]